MKHFIVALILLIGLALAFGQSANTPFVTVTGANANYAGGTISSALVRPGKPNAIGTTVVLTGTGSFSMTSWNNSDSHNAPSTTIFTITTANGRTSYTTPPLTISQSQDISSQLSLATIPQ